MRLLVQCASARKVCEDTGSERRGAAAATDEVLVRVVLPSRLDRARRFEPAGGPGSRAVRAAQPATGSGVAARRAGGPRFEMAIDDHSRLAYAELLPSESPAACCAFLRCAFAWYGERGIRVERVLSDSGNGYRSHAWAAACAEFGVARRSTRPRRPQTNGKAEALVKTLVREWAYRFAYPTSAHRARALPGYLRWYNGG